MVNAQAGNANWHFNMLLGKDPYKGNVNHIGLAVRVHAQITVAVHHAWTQLPIKWDISVSLSYIKQGPNEPFQEFVDHLLKLADRSFGDSQTGIPFFKQLAYENANAAHRVAICPYRTKTELSGYICPCAEIGSSYNQGLAMAAALKGQQHGQCFCSTERMEPALDVVAWDILREIVLKIRE